MPNSFVYCRETTASHPLSIKNKESLVPLNQMMHKEGAKKCSFFSYDNICIDLDSVEVLLAKEQNRDRSSTTDFAIGIKTGKLTKMLLGECRFNYGSAKHISKSELDSKVKGSMILFGYDIDIYNEIFFLFNPKVQPEAYQKLRRFTCNKRKYIAVTIYSFAKAILD